MPCSDVDVGDGESRISVAPSSYPAKGAGVFHPGAMSRVIDELAVRGVTSIYPCVCVDNDFAYDRSQTIRE